MKIKFSTQGIFLAPMSVYVSRVKIPYNRSGPVRKAPSSLFTMAIFPGTIALAACSLLHLVGMG